MKGPVFYFMLMLISTVTPAQEDVQYYFAEAKKARQANDSARFYEMIVKAGELHPYHQSIMYYRGLAAALTGRQQEAVDFLQKAIWIYAPFDLSAPELQTLKGTAAFENLKTQQQELLKPIVHSDTAFLISDRTLHPESIAAGEAGEFFVTSVHKRKITRVDQHGKISGFTTEAQDGITALLGIKVDKSKKVLWACSSPMPEMENFDTLSRSAVFKYDLQSGKLLARFTPDASVKNSVFGDLILNRNGEVFISDSQSNTIFKVNESTQKLEPYFTAAEFWNIQGIAFSDDEQFLFIADYIKGLFRLHVQTKELKPIATQPGFSLKGIDGLLWYKNSLIAIQNGISPMRVTRYFLNNTQQEITHTKILDRGHPAFQEPTNGCVVGNTLYYIGNSQWGGYDENHRLKPLDQLQDVVILKAGL
jgi:outer membrane protein assembly factor BamB